MGSCGVEVDYVIFNEEGIARWMQAMPKKADNKIRVLLPEREGWCGPSVWSDAPQWYRELEKGWNQEDLRRTRGSGFEPSLDLDSQPLAPDEQVAIVEAIRNDRAPSGSTKVSRGRLPGTQGWDKQNRPLCPARKRFVRGRVLV